MQETKLLNNSKLLLWLVLVGLFAAVLVSVAEVLVPFILAMVLSYVGKPLVELFVNKGNLGRTAAATLTLLVVCLALLLVPLIAIPIVVTQLIEVISSLPETLGNVWQWIINIVPSLDTTLTREGLNNLVSSLEFDLADFSKIGNVLGFFGQQVSVIFSLVFTLIVTPLATFYLLRDWPTLIETIHRHIPKQLRPPVVSVATITDRVLGEFLRSQISVILVMVVVYSVLLGIAGTPFAVAIGVITGLLSFIPYVGATIGILLATLATFLDFSGWTDLVWTLLAMGIGLALENFWITPKNYWKPYRTRTSCSTFALSVMGAAFGFAGLLLALPMAAVAMALWQHFLPSEETTTADAV